MKVATGLDRLADNSKELVAGRSVALLAHPASVDQRLRPARDVLVEAGAKIVALLGPEHGIGGAAQDMEGVGDGPRDTGPRLFSLYGDTFESLRPTPDMLEGADLVVADLQDVGSRYYTYVWTVALTLETCAEVGIELLVLDRPNPLNGATVEGPGIEEGFNSFVGHHDLATRHGMTLGEILRLYAVDRGLEAHLEILAMEGWCRGSWFDETGLPWVFPSPNMPTLDTAIVYPGGCLLEGTTLSEGRGTTRPFEVFGAPWVDGDRLAASLRREELPGCGFRPLQFKPTFQKYAGHLCSGVQIHVFDRNRYHSLQTGVAILRALWSQAGEERERFWRTLPYEFIDDRPAIDLLAGGEWLRDGIESMVPLEELCRSWIASRAAFEARRAEAVIYRP